MEEVVNYLIKLSDAKAQLLESLYQLSLLQEKALEDNSIDFLNKAIAEKQNIMKRIDILDKEFLDKYEAVKNRLGITSLESITGEPAKGFKELQEKVRYILEIVDKIRVVDDSNMKKAKANLDESQRQLKSLRVGKKAYSSYNKKSMEGASIFMDKKE